MEADMTTRQQSPGGSLQTEPVADLTPRRLRREFRRRRSGWDDSDMEMMERLYPNPTQSAYFHPSALSRAKTDRNYNDLVKLRKHAKELAVRGDQQAFEQLALHVAQMFAEIRHLAPDLDAITELLRKTHHELEDVQSVSVDALADGVVDAPERSRIARETEEGLAALRRLRRKVRGQT